MRFTEFFSILENNLSTLDVNLQYFIPEGLGVRLAIATNHIEFLYVITYVAAVALTPSTTHPHTQADLVRYPVRGQEQPDVSPVPS